MRHYGRPHHLHARIHDVDKHRDGLRYHDEHLKLLELPDVVQQKIAERDDDERVPPAVEQQEVLVEWYHVINSRMHDVAG